MKTQIKVSGKFRILVTDEDGNIKNDVETNNSLTLRGAIEFIGRLQRIGVIADSEGGPINDGLNVFPVDFRTIDEQNFVALDRLDRVRYFDAFGTPILLDNRQWQFEGNDEPNWGSFNASIVGGNRYDQYPYPTLTDVLTGSLPFTNYDSNLDIRTVRYKSDPHRQGEAAVWKGICLYYDRTSAFGRAIRAVLASAVLDDPLVVRKDDFTTMFYTFGVSATLP
jgi:hypothetical protein